MTEDYKLEALLKKVKNIKQYEFSGRTAQCTDPGPVVGGFGGVKVKMWIEPISD